MFEEPENGRNIRFQWHNALTETEWVADDILAFEAGGSEGTLDAPFILHFSKADEVDLESAGHLMAIRTRSTTSSSSLAEQNR